MTERNLVKNLDTIERQSATQDAIKKSLNQSLLLPPESGEKNETFAQIGSLSMMKNDGYRITEPDEEKYQLDEFDLDQDIEDVDEFDLLQNIDLDYKSQHRDVSKRIPGKTEAKIKNSKITKKQIDQDLEEQEKQKEITQEFYEFLNKKQKKKESATSIQKGKAHNGKAVSTSVALRRKIDKQMKNIDEVPAVAQVQPLAMLIDFDEVKILAPNITEEQIKQLKSQFQSAPRRTVVKLRNILDQAKEEPKQEDSQMTASNQSKGETINTVTQRQVAFSELTLQPETKQDSTKGPKNFANIAKRVKQIVAKTKSKMQGIVMNKDDRFDKQLEVFKGLTTFVEIKPFLAQINELNEDEQEKAHQALKQMSQKDIFQHVRGEMEQLFGQDADKDIESSLAEHLPVLERSYKHLHLHQIKRLNFHERVTEHYYQVALQLVNSQKEANTAITADLAADYERGFTSMFSELVMQLSTAKAEGDQGSHELNIFQQKQLELFKTIVRDVHRANKGDQAEDQLSTVKAYEHFKQRSNKILKLLVKASKNILKKNLIETGSTIDPTRQMRIIRKQEDQRKKFDELKNKLDEYKRMKFLRQQKRNIEFLQTIRESEEGHAQIASDGTPLDNIPNINLTQHEEQMALSNSGQNFIQSTVQNTPVANSPSQRQNTFILMQQLQDAQKKIDAAQNSPKSKGYSTPVHFPSLNRQILKPNSKNVSFTLDQSLIDRQTLERSIEHSQRKIQHLRSQSTGYLQDSIRQKSSGFSQMRLKQMLFKDLYEDNMPKQVEVFKQLVSESQAVQKKLSILHNLQNSENLQNNLDSVIEFPKIPSNKISSSISFSSSLIDTTARTGNFARQNSRSVQDYSNKRKQQLFVNASTDGLTSKVDSPADSKKRSHQVSSSLSLHNRSSRTALDTPSLSQVIPAELSSKQQQQQHSRFFTEQVQQKPQSAKSNKIIQSIFGRQNASGRKASIKSSINDISSQTGDRLTQSRIFQEEDDAAVRARNAAHREVVSFKFELKELFTEIRETITENKQQRAQELREIENLGSISQEMFEKQREKPLESIRYFEKVSKNPLIMNSFKKKTMRSIL